jgi:hypothetical protein
MLRDHGKPDIRRRDAFLARFPHAWNAPQQKSLAPADLDRKSRSQYALGRALPSLHPALRRRVNEQVPVSQWVFRDWGFILLGAAFFILGYVLNAGARQGLAPGAA